jgi:glycosyltransferase involved in cell wall biosynthesis
MVTEAQRLRPELSWRFVVRRAGDEKPLGTRNETDVVVFDAKPYGPRTTLGLGRVLGNRPADLFHSPFHVLPRGIECPSVLTMHDDFNFDQNVFSNYAFPINWMEWGYFMLAIPDSARRARRILCVSETTARAIAARMPECKDKLRVVHHGVASIFRVRDDANATRQRCEQLVGSSDEFILSTGGVSPNKNHENTLRAFARAFPSPSRMRLVRVSRFGSGLKLERLARELGVSDRYVALQQTSDDDVVALLNGAAFLVFCSIREGFGLPILEAMACGCPVLTSNVSCLPEVGGDAALYCDPHDTADVARQMERLATEPSLREDLRGRGLARARAFTWERAAAQTLEVYDEALR